MSDPAPTDRPMGLEPPTGTRRIRGPTLYVLGLLIAVALGAIVRTCVR